MSPCKSINAKLRKTNNKNKKWKNSVFRVFRFKLEFRGCDISLVMAYVKDISDIPLKKTQETFVDDPTSIDEVFIDDLVFDINHGIKNINKLHVFHAIVVLCTTLKDIIKLQSNPELFQKFKHQQLLKYGINLDDYKLTPPPPLLSTSSSVSSSDPTSRVPTILSSSIIPPGRSSTPPLSPPLKFAKLNRNDTNTENFESLRESTPNSLSNSESNQDEKNEDDLQDDTTNENIDQSNDDNESHDNYNNNEQQSNAPYIPIDELIKNCSLEPIENPITDINNDKFFKEYQYNQDLKRQHQTTHLLKSFKLLKIPPLTIDQFLIRIKTYSSSISVSSYIHSASMLFKLCILLDIVPLTESNVYRLILASIRCSTKKLEDVYQKQKSFATVGGITTKDLFRLEVSFLYLCNFKLIISENVLDNFLTTEFTALRGFCKDHFES
ncbi:cyclin-domain-containing protein [Scheffersomyces coipomensis]|uniref:cyclin-domain-containing protein n=1 Tax=Scheffersomyces coipomensis TaxID=1788519 RepID=UPI00315CA09F